MAEEAPVIVVGAGVIGLLTAVSCASSGQQVVVLERGPIPNPRSTSYAAQRILRALHPGDPKATRRAVMAERHWRRLEHMLGEHFYHPVGSLTVLPRDRAEAARRTMAGAGARAEVLPASELLVRWPHIRFQTQTCGVLEPDAGVLLADLALEAMARWLAGHPCAQLRPHEEVVAVDTREGGVRLRSGEALRGSRIVLATGPWSRQLLTPAASGRLALFRQTVLLCRVPPRLRAAWSSTPAIPALAVPYDTWLVPPVAGTPLELAAATATREVTEVAGRVTPVRWREHLIRRFRRRLVGFTPSWVGASRECYYLADALTGGPRTARSRGGKASVRAHAACGGTSFKFAPLIARSLAGRRP
jgi:glycine/D-amino acid oxidase-like deaminating enzyme